MSKQHHINYFPLIATAVFLIFIGLIAYLILNLSEETPEEEILIIKGKVVDVTYGLPITVMLENEDGTFALKFFNTPSSIPIDKYVQLQFKHTISGNILTDIIIVEGELSG